MCTGAYIRLLAAIMKKLLLISLILITSCQKDKTLNSSSIEVKMGRLYEINESIPFNGYIQHEKDSIYKLKFRVRSGFKDGSEIILKFNGDTIAYNIYEEGLNVYNKAFDELGKPVYTIDKRNTEIENLENKNDLIKKNIISGNYSFLDLNNISLLKNNLANNFWRDVFKMQNITYGKIKGIETVNMKTFLTKTNDTLKRFEYLIKYPNVEIPLKIESINDSISSFKYTPIHTDFIPKTKYLSVFENLKNYNIKVLFNEIGGENSPENIKEVETQFKQLGVIINEKEPEFIHHYVNLINGTPVVTSDYLLNIKNGNNILEHRLMISFKPTNNDFKLYQFYVTPLKFPLTFE